MARLFSREHSKQALAVEWSKEYLKARVSNESQRKRYAAGCPDESEVSLYRLLVMQVDQRQKACCLGMTPELRSVLAQCYEAIVSADCSQAAIETYAAWLPDEERKREEIKTAEWLSFLQSSPQCSIDCVAGDAILANLSGEGEARQLIQAIHRVLRPTGALVMRCPVMPSVAPTWLQLREAYRSGLIDQAGFGCGSRLLGHSQQFYDAKTGILDNSKVFAEYHSLRQVGELTEEEIELINRYLFLGLNWIPTEARWQEFLNSLPFETQCHSLEGKHWYQYYKIYEMTPL